MSLNNGSIGVNQRRQSGSPFVSGSAWNGLSVDGTGKIVLGQDVGAAGNPAGLLNNREVPMLGKTFTFLGSNIRLVINDTPLAGQLSFRTSPLNYFFLIDPFANLYQMGDILGTTTGHLISIQNSGGQDQILLKNTANTTRAGINKSTPAYNLDVFGNFGVSNSDFSTNASVNAAANVVSNTDFRLSLQRYGNAAGSNGLIFYKTRGATANTLAAVSNGDQLGTINVHGVGTTPAFAANAVRVLYSAGTVGAGFVGGEIFWQTTNSTGTLGSRMKLTENGQLGIGTNAPDASAKLHLSTTTQGFLPPVMTTVQKNAIAAPASGLIIYDSTLGKLCVFTGAVWETVTSV